MPKQNHSTSQQRQHHEWEGAIWDSELDSTKTLILLALKSYADGTGESCFPSVETLSRKTRFTDRTIRRHLHEMEELGLITITARASKSGTTSNDYRLHFEAIKAGGVVTQDHQGLILDQGGADLGSGGGLILDQGGADLGSGDLSKDLSSKNLSNSGGDLTRTEEQDHDDDFFAELQPIAQAPLPPEPQAPKPEPQIIPSVNSIQDLQGQGEAPPVPPPPPKVPPRNPSLAPNPSARVGNGTPWAPLAPWTSREEYEDFKAWLVAAYPDKGEGYIHSILIRVEKGDFDNRSWQGFKAGSSPDNTPAGTNTPKEWQDAVQAIFDGLGSNPFYATREADRWAESYQQFRRLYSYDSKGQPVRWPAADSWALAQAKAILAAAYPAAS